MVLINVRVRVRIRTMKESLTNERYEASLDHAQVGHDYKISSFLD